MVVPLHQWCALRGPYLPSEMQQILNAMVGISRVNRFDGTFHVSVPTAYDYCCQYKAYVTLNFIMHNIFLCYTALLF